MCGAGGDQRAPFTGQNAWLKVETPCNLEVRIAHSVKNVRELSTSRIDIKVDTCETMIQRVKEIM